MEIDRTGGKVTVYQARSRDRRNIFVTENKENSGQWQRK